MKNVMKFQLSGKKPSAGNQVLFMLYKGSRYGTKQTGKNCLVNDSHNDL